MRVAIGTHPHAASLAAISHIRVQSPMVGIGLSSLSEAPEALRRDDLLAEGSAAGRR
jgi:hypothetical protein